MEEFAAKGFERARLDQIAKAAGISKGTIYLYFPSKEALFFAAVEEHIVSVMAENETVLDSFEGTTGEMLTRLLKSVYGHLTEGRAPALFRILISEGERMPEVVTNYHELTVKRGSKLLRRILERGVARGEVSENALLNNPQVVIAPAMFFAIHNMVFYRTGLLDFDEYFDAHVELVLNGVLKR